MPQQTALTSMCVCHHGWGWRQVCRSHKIKIKKSNRIEAELKREGRGLKGDEEKWKNEVERSRAKKKEKVRKGCLPSLRKVGFCPAIWALCAGWNQPSGQDRSQRTRNKIRSPFPSPPYMPFPLCAQSSKHLPLKTIFKYHKHVPQDTRKLYPIPRN